MTIACYSILLIGLCHIKKILYILGDCVAPPSRPPPLLAKVKSFRPVGLIVSRSSVSFLRFHIVCHLVMSLCHDYFSLSLQTRYDIVWIIYMNKQTNNKQTNKY